MTYSSKQYNKLPTTTYTLTTIHNTTLNNYTNTLNIKMAFPEINNAVAKIVVDARVEVVDKVHAFLKEKLELEESDLNDLISEFKNTLDLTVKVTKGKGKKGSVAEEKPRKKREAGPYNKFLGEKIAELKATNTIEKAKGAGKIYMEHAQKAWKALKEEYPEHEKNSAKLYELWKESKGESVSADEE